MDTVKNMIQTDGHMTYYQIPLEGGKFIARMLFPSNLKPEHAERLCAFVRALTLPQVNEDELPPMTDEQYDAWFALSYVPDGVGCRMGPAIEVDRPRKRPSAATTTCILAQETYKPGDPAPEGYLAWHEWAETQHKAGLRQKACGKCGHLLYPQELSEEFVRWEATTNNGNIVKRIAPVCLKCKTA